ncbi:MAG: hypothetical protein Q8S84_05940 [bacterium]|nr:hypothetical protein [bacterium]MDP3381020.1 hypothetical protein [bacterium]
MIEDVVSFIACSNNSIVIILSSNCSFMLSKFAFSLSTILAKSSIDLLASRDTSSHIASISADTYQSVNSANLS